MNHPPPNPSGRVSASKYPGQVEAAARIRFRVKGEADGPVYQGQELIVPCVECQARMQRSNRSARVRAKRLTDAG